MGFSPSARGWQRSRPRPRQAQGLPDQGQAQARSVESKAESIVRFDRLRFAPSGTVVDYTQSSEATTVKQSQTPEANAPTPDVAALAQFPIVGIGASAGGLAASTELLRQLGPKPGVALVVIHHLDPTHESSLVEIFQRATTLPVHAVSDRARILIDQVYVMPPNSGVLLSDGNLKLIPRVEVAGLHMPIDPFFASLAANRTAYAVGVVLTGTGSDGAQGIRAIKEAGGITFAQDASAEYRSMPDAAIATGCIDFVLPPAAIAQELIRIGAHATPLSTADDGHDFQRVLLALRKGTGVDFANYKQTTIRRRVNRRVLVHRLSSMREYAELLERTAGEANALCEEVLIHVTSFFRDPETFDVLKATVFPKLLESQPRDAGIRIWVPGCSTGEEVYSIAISLLEFLTDTHASDVPIKLFGTDVSLSAIEKARAGIYAANIERDVSPGRLQRFFSSKDGFYQISKNVRDLCVFAKQDATRDPPFSAMNLISCRNLMIYLGSALQDRMLPIFHYALKEPGFLVLGTSETTRSFPGFAVLDAKNKVYTRTSAAPRLLFDFNDPRLVEPATSGANSAPKPSGPTQVHREADRLVLAHYAPPGVVVTDDLAIVQFRGKTGPFLEPTPGVPSFDLLRMVREELRLPLRQAIDDARTRRSATRRIELSAEPGSTPRSIEIEVIRFAVASAGQRFFVVLFKDVPLASEAPKTPEPRPPNALVVGAGSESALAQELASTRDYLQSVIEQLEASNEELKAANEEIVSSNEELRSTNEELQMAKEELQSTNEELRTVNEEMTVRNIDATRLNDDLTNVLNSVEIPILILGRDSCLRRFTPAAAKTLRLVAGDIGRPIAEIRAVIASSELAHMIGEVLEHLSSVSRAVQDDKGCWYQLAVRPYLTVDNRIDGTVITFFDIDEGKKSEQLITQAREYAEGIVDTVRECLIIVDRELRVLSANRSFHRTFDMTAEEVQGRYLYELGQGEWDVPSLRKRLEELGDGDKFEGFVLEQQWKRVGFRAFLLNARRIEHTPSMLLALEDVTESRHARQKLQHMAFDAALAEERERRRIAADLHDRIGQSLALAQHKLTAMRDSVSGALRAAMDEAVALLAQSAVDTRTLTSELSPLVLYDLGLKDALSWLVEDVEKRHGIHVELHDDDVSKPLDDATAALVFRAVRELLMNVFKHAQASTAKVSLHRTGDQVEVDVEDKGVGFEPADIAFQSARGGFGLFSVREQISRLGGTVDVVSAPRMGTRVSMRVPIKPEPIQLSTTENGP